MDSREKTESRGYLKEDFRLFHLCDDKGQELEEHYHDFDKIVIFLRGNVNYLVEGVSYILRPWDILLIGRDMVHRAVIDTSELYERIIIYVSREFISAGSTEETELSSCFRTAAERNFCLMRADEAHREEISGLVAQVERELSVQRFASDVMLKTLMLQIMATLNRVMASDATRHDGEAYKRDPKIGEIISYINGNLTENLSVGTLAERIYMSKYHFMRRFKELTGCTVHEYVRRKRILYAAELLRQGVGALRAAEMCGFQDYSAFQRAFRQFFGVTPSKYI